MLLTTNATRTALGALNVPRLLERDTTTLQDGEGKGAEMGQKCLSHDKRPFSLGFDSTTGMVDARRTPGGGPV